MKQRSKGLSAIGRLLLLLIIIGTVIGAAVLGPNRAPRIGAAAMSNKFLDRPDNNTEHRLRVLDIHVNKNDLADLNADLPWSGGQERPVTWKENGIDHRGTFRYRGLVSPTHYLGRKKSFRLSMKGSGPFRPIRTVNVINPKSLNMLNNHMALWIGGFMGVAVPYSELVYVRLNDEDHGVMELFEQIDGKFESYRNIRKGHVPVFKGDYPALEGRTRPENIHLWKNAEHWQFKGKADEASARTTLQSMIDLMRSRQRGVLDTLPISFADTLAYYIDVPDMLRFCAALKVLNTMHVDNYHNQWLIMNSDERFYPVLWDPLMMFPPKNEPWYPVHDALSFHLLSVPAWRVERDRMIHSALSELHVQGKFKDHYAAMQDKLRPSLMADPNKSGAITSDPYDVFPFSSVHAAISSDKLLEKTEAYWDKTMDRFKINDVRSIRRDSTLSISWKGVCAVELTLGADSLTPPTISNGSRDIPVYKQDGLWTCLLVPPVVHRGAKEANQYSDRTYYEVLPAKFNLRIRGYNGPIAIRNAVNHEPIKAQ